MQLAIVDLVRHPGGEEVTIESMGCCVTLVPLTRLLRIPGASPSSMIGKEFAIFQFDEQPDCNGQRAAIDEYCGDLERFLVTVRSTGQRVHVPAVSLFVSPSSSRGW